MPDETTDHPDSETTILAIQIERGLRQRIKAAASAEHRTESSFARYYLERAAEAALASGTSPTEEVAS
jgi:hypothetical protein